MGNILWILLGVLTTLSAFAGEEREVIAFRDAAAVGPGQVRLGQFADEEVRNRPQLKEIFNVVLGAAPRINELIKFQRTAVSQLISQVIAQSSEETRQTLSRFQFIIPKELLAEGAGWDTSVKYLKDNLILRMHKICGRDCEIVVEDLGPIQRPVGVPATAQIQLGEISALPRGAFNVMGLIVDDKVTLDRLWIQGRVRIYRWAPVATRLIPSGLRVQASDFEMKRVDMTHESDAPAKPEVLVGKKLARNVPMGKAILIGHISKEFDIGYGEPIRGILKSHDWQIVFEGVSRGTANVGDKVQVFNPSTKRVHLGTLVSQGIVEIK